ncbi:T-cell receptor alpha chain V region 2B4 [Fukomys damarensis]|nr:T-cell receptor alpha chain V region 2B4 [Fukomys damarensis]
MEGTLGALLGILWVQVCWVRGAEVEQSPSASIVQEGTNIKLRCNFSITIRSVQWFQQNPGGRLVNLFFMAPGTKRNGRLESTLNSKDRLSTLQITASELGDSGFYLCAAEAQCFQVPCSLAPNCSWA